MPPWIASAADSLAKLLICLGVLALLVCNTAAGLASGLARGLALAATAVLGAEILCLDGLDMLHFDILHEILLMVLNHKLQIKSIQGLDLFYSAESFFLRIALTMPLMMRETTPMANSTAPQIRKGIIVLFIITLITGIFITEDTIEPASRAAAEKITPSVI